MKLIDDWNRILFNWDEFWYLWWWIDWNNGFLRKLFWDFFVVFRRGISFRCCGLNLFFDWGSFGFRGNLFICLL